MGIFSAFFKPPAVDQATLSQYIPEEGQEVEKRFNADDCIKSLSKLAEDSNKKEENAEIAILLKYCLTPKLEAYKQASTEDKQEATKALLKSFQESEKTLKTFFGDHPTLESSVIQEWANLLRPEATRITARRISVTLNGGIN